MKDELVAKVHPTSMPESVRAELKHTTGVEGSTAERRTSKGRHEERST